MITNYFWEMPQDRKQDRHRQPRKTVRYTQDDLDEIESESKRLGLSANYLIVLGSKLMLRYVKYFKKGNNVDLESLIKMIFSNRSKD